MTHQDDIDGFSVPVVFRSKAQCAGNGRLLAKHCNPGLAMSADRSTEPVNITLVDH